MMGCLLKNKYAVLGLLIFLAAPSAFAYDFGAAGYIAAIGVTAIGVAAFIGAAPALATLAIGATVMGVTFDKTESTGAPLVVQISPAAKLATPAGWSPPVSPQSDPIPPATAQQSTQWSAMGGAVFTTPGDACEASRVYGAYQSVCGVTVLAPPQSSVCSLERVASAGGGCFDFYLIPIVSCPPGYGDSGSGCALQTPGDVPKPSDGACGIKRVGNTFSTDTQDPDCSTLPANASVTPNSVTQTRPDGSQKSVVINSDGSVTATDSRPDAGTNTTQTNTTQFGVPNASGMSSVTGQGSGATNGTGSSNSGQPVPTFDKSGLATEGTLGGIKTDTGAIKDALTNPGTADSTLGGPRGVLSGVMDGIAGVFGNEPGKTSVIADDFSVTGFMPAACGCTPLSMSFRGHTASFDWCTPMATFKGVLAWVIGLFTAFYMFSLLRIGGGK